MKSATRFATRLGPRMGRNPVLSGFCSSLLLATFAYLAPAVKATPLGLDLNRGLQIGWYSMRVQNPFGTNYTGLKSLKRYNPDTKEFAFLDFKGQEVLIKATDISFIYFRQLPDRADVNVNAGDIRNIQITPYREMLYDIPPGRLAIQDGSLLLDTRWRIGVQKPFDVNTRLPAKEDTAAEKMEIPRRIQLNYLGNHYLVETELVNIIVRSAPLPGAGNVPSRLPTVFPVPAPAP